MAAIPQFLRPATEAHTWGTRHVTLFAYYHSPVEEAIEKCSHGYIFVEHGYANILDTAPKKGRLGYYISINVFSSNGLHVGSLFGFLANANLQNSYNTDAGDHRSAHR